MRFSFSLLFLIAALSLAACAAGPGQFSSQIPEAFLGLWEPRSHSTSDLGFYIHPDGQIQILTCAIRKKCGQEKPLADTNYKIIRIASSTEVYILVKLLLPEDPGIQKEISYSYWHLVFTKEHKNSNVDWDTLYKYTCLPINPDESTWNNFDAQKAWDTLVCYFRQENPGAEKPLSCAHMDRRTYSRFTADD